MLKRQKWTQEEDETLVRVIQSNKGSRLDWEEISEKLVSKGIKKHSKQARDRWTHHLSPKVNRMALTKADNIKLFELHAALGCHWKQISENFPGKTDNHVKNIFFAQIRKSLRKARKLSGTPNVLDSINFLKPKVLSNFVVQDILLPDELYQPGKTLPFMASNPISVRQFIFFFAYAKASELSAAKGLKISGAIDFVFDFLDNMNGLYLQARKVSTNPVPTPRLSMTQSQIARSKSIKTVGRELLFYLKSAERELQTTSCRDDLITSFQKMSECSAQIASLLEKTTDISKETKELSSIFCVSNPSPNNSLRSNVDAQLPPGVTSLIPSFVINPRVSAEKLSQLFEPVDEIGFAGRPEETFSRCTKPEESIRLTNRLEDSRIQIFEELERNGFRDSRNSFERTSFPKEPKPTFGTNSFLFGAK